MSIGEEPMLHAPPVPSLMDQTVPELPLTIQESPTQVELHHSQAVPTFDSLETGGEVVRHHSAEEPVEEGEDFYFLHEPTVIEEPAAAPTGEDELDHTLVDATFDMACRTFYATCHKFARQSYPEYRRRSPYSFLENWLLHSMYSKSQQIMLGIPNVRPTVILTSDDFMFTPPLLQQQRQLDEVADQMQLHWEEDQDDGYAEMDPEQVAATLMPPDNDGVMVMTAAAPDGTNQEDSSNNPSSASFVMDENTWMAHSRPHHQKMLLHVVNADPDTIVYTQQQEQPTQHPDDEIKYDFRHGYQSNCTSSAMQQHTARHGRQLSMVIEEDEEDIEEDDDEEEDDEDDDEEEAEDENDNQKSDESLTANGGLTMSPELVDWYRSTEHRRPSTIMEFPISNTDHDEKGKDVQRETNTQTSSSSACATNALPERQPSPLQLSEIAPTSSTVDRYQSLTDMMPADAVIISIGHPHGYGAVTRSLEPESPTDGLSNALEALRDRTQRRLYGISDKLVETADMALAYAESFAESNEDLLAEHCKPACPQNSIARFVTYVFRVWKVLFISAESILGNVGGWVLLSQKDECYTTPSISTLTTA
ncbi:hypothetical protein EC973_004973 [Apophysomyces ossiformis]|uniref:Uncharacterized protein n=1 Tax=Apophysomyces ossiformis TaxID=679940 RepID=A0A8H7EL74_9FUNG|nr:hypothetical protein EC973_004973 [Apophysomyces ossiformis]